MKRVFKANNGFTLAEVLITLGIIGVVAAMTIPTLMNKTQNQEYMSGLKKLYSVTLQSLNQMSADRGCVGDLSCTGLFTTDPKSTLVADELIKHFNVTKYCGDNPNSYATTYPGGCTFCSGVNCGWYKNWDGSSASPETWGGAFFTTLDGAIINIYNYESDCKTDKGDNAYDKTICAFIVFDVNGAKKPNTMGRDSFWFYVTNKPGGGIGLQPYGAKDDTSDWWWQQPNPNYCTSAGGSKDGLYCTGRVIEEGWKMNY